MNDQPKIEQFAIGSLVLAASREAAIRAEVLRVGDAVRLLEKPGSFGEAKVHTGVIVGFEPFKDMPTVQIAYIEHSYSKAELKLLAYTEGNEKYDVVAAPKDFLLEVERDRVLEYFDAETRKLQGEIDTLRRKRAYFEQHFGKLFAEIEGPSTAKVTAK